MTPPRAQKPIPPAEEYARVFGIEQTQEYPTIDAIEARAGYALDRGTLETAARVLACPVKAHPPNWQHGRVIYAVVRCYLAGGWIDATHLRGSHREHGATPAEPITMLDIGTAKGFSALCLLWALTDAGRQGTVTSIDVLDPTAAVQRNTVAECDGLKTLAATLAQWPESVAIRFQMSTGIEWLSNNKGRVHVAFIDGKHSYESVRREGQLLAKRQQPGDLAIFDDLQSEGVRLAVDELRSAYTLERVEAHAHRIYAIGVRR